MSSSNLNYVISIYLQDLEMMKGCSSKTINSYKIDLEQFKIFSNENNKDDLKLMNDKFVKRYLHFLNENDYDKSSIARKLSVVRGIFNFALKNNIIEKNLVSFIKSPKIERKLPEVIAKSDYEIILHKINEDNSISEYSKKLQKAIFELLYGCSIRLAELCNLNYGDLDIYKKTLSVLGKGKKYRIVPVGDKSLEIIQQYLELNTFVSNENPLLIIETGTKIYPRYVQRIVKKYLSLSTNLKKKSPHILRHSSATHMLDNDANLIAIKEILGHSNLSTTQIYTHLSIEKLKKIYNKSHPKS